MLDSEACQELFDRGGRKVRRPAQLGGCRLVRQPGGINDPVSVGHGRHRVAGEHDRVQARARMTEFGHCLQQTPGLGLRQVIENIPAKDEVKGPAVVAYDALYRCDSSAHSTDLTASRADGAEDIDDLESGRERRHELDIVRHRRSEVQDPAGTISRDPTQSLLETGRAVSLSQGPLEGRRIFLNAHGWLGLERHGHIMSKIMPEGSFPCSRQRRPYLPFPKGFFRRRCHELHPKAWRGRSRRLCPRPFRSLRETRRHPRGQPAAR